LRYPIDMPIFLEKTKIPTSYSFKMSYIIASEVFFTFMFEIEHSNVTFKLFLFHDDVSRETSIIFKFVSYMLYNEGNKVAAKLLYICAFIAKIYNLYKLT
jgi:hypothetical protein